jgi:hypothetical protein
MCVCMLRECALTFLVMQEWPANRCPVVLRQLLLSNFLSESREEERILLGLIFLSVRQ